MKKGASEDHAIMLTNMMLALGLDTYLCTGRAWVQYMDDQTDEMVEQVGDEEHVWVMVRWPDKAISFFETVSGFQYRLEERWVGCEEEDSEEDEAPAEGEEGNTSLLSFMNFDVQLCFVPSVVMRPVML